MSQLTVPYVAYSSHMHSIQTVSEVWAIAVSFVNCQC